MTAKLVKARLKRVEDLPEFLMCCPKAIAALHEAYENNEEFVLAMDSAVPHAGECRYCGQQDPQRIRLSTPDGTGFVYADEVDLDEGPTA